MREAISTFSVEEALRASIKRLTDATRDKGIAQGTQVWVSDIRMVLAVLRPPEEARGLHDLTDEDMQRASIDWSIAEVDLGLSDTPWGCMEHVLKMFIRHRRAGGNPNPVGGE